MTLPQLHAQQPTAATKVERSTLNCTVTPVLATMQGAGVISCLLRCPLISKNAAPHPPDHNKTVMSHQELRSSVH